MPSVARPTDRADNSKRENENDNNDQLKLGKDDILVAATPKSVHLVSLPGLADDSEQLAGARAVFRSFARSIGTLFLCRFVPISISISRQSGMACTSGRDPAPVRPASRSPSRGTSGSARESSVRSAGIRSRNVCWRIFRHAAADACRGARVRISARRIANTATDSPGSSSSFSSACHNLCAAD